MPDWIKKVFRFLSSLAWALLILLLPISSMPLVTKIVHSDMVAAPSALPMAFLVVVWLLPYLLKKGGLPRQTAPLIGFLIVALLSSLGAYFLETPSFKQTSLLSREIKQLFTLGVGVGFYLVASTWPRNLPRLRQTLRWINISGLILIAWSLWQAYNTFVLRAYPDWMQHFQENVISVSHLFDGRVTGFAFEPSWLAHQLNMVYLPYWLAASVLRFSAHSRKILGLRVENILLLGGLATLFFSYSRVGELALLLVIAYLLVQANLLLIRKIRDWIRRTFRGNATQQFFATSGLTVAITFVFLLAYIGGAYALARVISHRDVRVARIFETPVELSFEYINQLSFAERAVYWATGWNIFNDHPLMGVGIGNAGFYFVEKLPPFSWQLVEVNNLIFHSTSIPNTKSLWVRILAETGIIGFAFYMAWYFVLWQSGRMLRKETHPLLHVIGLTGVLALVALIIEGFSVDSFALPYIWVTQGLLTSASRLIGEKHSSPLAQETALTHLSQK